MTTFNTISPGDRVEVQIESPASPFGGTQTGVFDVTELSDEKDVVFGVDPNWGDECEVLGGAGVPHYADGGKSGDVVSVEVMETTDDGVTIHGSGTTVYDREEEAL